MMRLADKAAMRIMSISRSIRTGATLPRIIGTPAPTLELPSASIPATAEAAPSELPGLNETGVDKPTVMHGGDMLTALIEGQQ